MEAVIGELEANRRFVRTAVIWADLSCALPHEWQTCCARSDGGREQEATNTA